MASSPLPTEAVWQRSHSDATTEIITTVWFDHSRDARASKESHSAAFCDEHSFQRCILPKKKKHLDLHLNFISNDRRIIPLGICVTR